MSLIASDNHAALLTVLLTLVFVGLWSERNRVASKIPAVVWVLGGGVLLSNLELIPHQAPAYDFARRVVGVVFGTCRVIARLRGDQACLTVVGEADGKGATAVEALGDPAGGVIAVAPAIDQFAMVRTEVCGGRKAGDGFTRVCRRDPVWPAPSGWCRRQVMREIAQAAVRTEAEANLDAIAETVTAACNRIIGLTPRRFTSGQSRRSLDGGRGRGGDCGGDWQGRQQAGALQVEEHPQRQGEQAGEQGRGDAAPQIQVHRHRGARHRPRFLKRRQEKRDQQSDHRDHHEHLDESKGRSRRSRAQRDPFARRRRLGGTTKRPSGRRLSSRMSRSSWEHQQSPARDNPGTRARSIYRTARAAPPDAEMTRPPARGA